MQEHLIILRLHLLLFDSMVAAFNLSCKQFIKKQFLVFFAREQIGAPRRGTLGDVVRLFFELKMYAFVI